ncbi:MAG TPA: protein kinase, partial [Thermoanaerobaculia bacterium]|nr:protein kinase [Thermoanaerobaculia bacterium]
PLDEALALASDILRGLGYAHSKGIVHRDIKPANILLTTDGHAKIADFGVARPLHSSLTATRSLVGTPNYMSPEQVKTTPVSPRSDLFSAGVVMYEMLTGLKPFGAPELSGILYNVVNLVPPRVNETNPSVPQAIARIVAKLLEKQPEDRYRSADEALADVDVVRDARAAMMKSGELETLAISQGDATTPLPTIVEQKPLPLIRRRIHPLLVWVVTLALIGALAASVIALRRGTSQQPAAVMTAEQRQQIKMKRRSLEAARALTAAGKHEEAIAAYDAHTARYPESVIAKTERAAAQQLLDAAKKPDAEITTVADKPRRSENARPKRDNDEPEQKKLSRWQRMKRWLAEDPSKPKKERQ